MNVYLIRPWGQESDHQERYLRAWSFNHAKQLYRHSLSELGRATLPPPEQWWLQLHRNMPVGLSEADRDNIAQCAYFRAQGLSMERFLVTSAIPENLALATELRQRADGDYITYLSYSTGITPVTP